MTLLAIAAQLEDLGTFVPMILLGGAGMEANPIVRLLLLAGGIPLAAAAKLALIAVLAIVRPTSLAPAGQGLGLLLVLQRTAIVVGLVGACTNLATIAGLA